MHRPHCAVVVLGHTGHGKTSLVDALRGQPGPARRINDADVKVVRCSTSNKRYTLFDVPGGPRSLHAALRATPMADVAVLVVSSIAGPQAFTREHLLAAKGMGVQHIVVVINDHDGDRTLLDACELEVRSLLSEHGEAGDEAAIIVASLRDDVVRAAAEVFAVLDATAHRFYDDEADACLRVLFRHPGLSAPNVHGRELAVSSGQLAAGTLRVGDAVRVVGDRAALTPLFFHSPASQQRAARDPNIYGRGPGWVGPTYTPPAYVPPPRGQLERLARIEQLQVARRDVDVVTAGEQVGVQLSFAAAVPRVDRFTSVIVRADHPDPAQVVLTTLTLRPSAIGGPRRRIDTARNIVVWSGAYATLAVMLLLDEHRRDVDSVGPDSTFLVAIVLSAPRFIGVGQALVVASNVGVFATGVVAEVVGAADAAAWFARLFEIRAARDARRAPALFA